MPSLYPQNTFLTLPKFGNDPMTIAFLLPFCHTMLHVTSPILHGIVLDLHVLRIVKFYIPMQRTMVYGSRVGLVSTVVLVRYLQDGKPSL